VEFPAENGLTIQTAPERQDRAAPWCQAVNKMKEEILAVNIEIKARVRKPEKMETLIRNLSDRPVEILHQVDTFFQVSEGRLKLREHRQGPAQLIFYQRADQTGPRPSRYRIVPASEPDILKQVLTDALGLLGVIRKTRRLYRAGNTRIHLDSVEGLGTFLELEVVLDPDQTFKQGRTRARQLMKDLEVSPEDLVEGAYLDLLRQVGSNS
jgi:adenylate cyclase class IV